MWAILKHGRPNAVSILDTQIFLGRTNTIKDLLDLFLPIFRIGQRDASVGGVLR